MTLEEYTRIKKDVDEYNEYCSNYHLYSEKTIVKKSFKEMFGYEIILYPHSKIKVRS